MRYPSQTLRNRFLARVYAFLHIPAEVFIGDRRIAELLLTSPTSCPPPTPHSSLEKLSINHVSMEHANGVYFHSTWSRVNDNIPEDWTAFILGTVARGQKYRTLAEAAPHKPLVIMPKT